MLVCSGPTAPRRRPSAHKEFGRIDVAMGSEGSR
jgi:hypothetical protein